MPFVHLLKDTLVLRLREVPQWEHLFKVLPQLICTLDLNFMTKSVANQSPLADSKSLGFQAIDLLSFLLECGETAWTIT